MRKFIMLLTSVLLLSCQSDELKQQNESRTIDDILFEMKNLADANNQIVRFEIENSDNGYLTNDVKILESFVDKFAFEFENTQEKTPGTVIVDCHFEDGTSTSTTCPPGQNQGSCVGSATIGCMLQGGCSTSCMQKTIVTILPEGIKHQK